MLKRLAELADRLDQKGLKEEANVVDSIIQEAAVKKSSTKLTKRQTAAMRSFYKSASKVLDTVSVGRREFPERATRLAVASIMQNLENSLDKLEKFRTSSGEAVISPDMKKERQK